MPTVPSVNQDDSLSLDEARALAGGGPEPASDGSLSLDEARKLVRGNLSTQLRATTSVNAERDPATVAEAQRLGAQYGLPTALAEQNLDALRQEETLRSADRLAQDSPRLAEWFIEDPDAAAISRDAVQPLSTIERAFQAYTDVVYRAPISGATGAVGGIVGGLGDAMGLVPRAISRTGESVIRFFSEDLADQYRDNADEAQDRIPWWMMPDQLLIAGGQKIKEGGQAIAVPEDRQNYLTDVGGGIGSFVPTAAAFFINPTLGLVATGAQGADIQAERAREAGTYGTLSSDVGIALGAPITALTEKLGYGWLMRTLPAPARNALATRVGDIIKSGAGEAAQEVSEAVLQDAITKAMVDENFDMFQGLDREGLAAFGVGAVIRGVVHLRRANADAGMAQAEQRNMEEIARAVDSTGLREQAPNVLQSALARLKGSGKTEVYVPVEQFQTLFQGENEADEARRAAGIDDAEYAAALTTNGKLRVSTEGFFAGLDPKQRDALIPHARWTHEGMTPEEALAFDPEKAMTEFMTELGIEGRATDPSNRAFDYVRMALEQAGATPDVAETQAEMVAAQLRTLAYRSGVSMDDLMGPQGQERLTIRRAVDERVAQLMAKQDTDATVDSLIDAVRSGRLFTDSEINGQRLVSAIIRSGGVRPDAFGVGDLKAQDASKARPGFFNQDGMTLDQVLQMARDDGFILPAIEDAPDDFGINELNDLIISDLRGDAQYRIGGMNESRMAFNDAAAVLADELAALGIDREKLAGMTNAQVRQALAATMKGEMLDQSVFHGSPHRFDRFTLQAIGTGEGAQAYGWGLYFAGKKEIAEWYREQLSRRNEAELWTDELRSQLPEPLTPAELNERGALGRKMLSGLSPQEMARWRELKDREDAYNEAVERLRPQGQLYAAEIPDDGDLLDYDATLDQQPEKVRDALKRAFIARGMPLAENGEPLFFARNPTGQSMYAALGGIRGERAASEALLAAGIPGLRYLDGTSRGAGDGSRNYVIWDEGAISDVKTFYQSEQQRTPAEKELVAIHNLSAENLLFADKLGGLAVPSIGVTKADTQFAGFGDITLIGRRDLATPSDENPVFSADAYTQRFPDLIWAKVPSKKANEFVDSFGESYQERDTGQFWDDLVNRPNRDQAIYNAGRSSTMMRAWLKEQGETPAARVTAELRTPGRAEWAKQPAFIDAITAMTERGIDVRDARPGDEAWSEISRAAMQALEAEAQTYADLSPEVVDHARKGMLKAAFEGEELFWSAGENAVSYVRKINEPRGEDHSATRRALEAQIGDRKPQFEQWVAEKIAPLFDPPKIMVGKRKVDMTLANVVEAMTASRKVAGKEKTMTFGGGQVKAANAKQFKSLDEIKAARDLIVSPDEERAAGDATGKLMSQYRDAALQFFTQTDWRGNIDTWAGLDASMKALADAAKKAATPANVRAALQKNGFRGMDAETIKLGVQALQAVRQTVVDYFEAKPQRAVSLSEFAGAVIPSNASQEVRDALARAGVPVAEYDRADNDARRATVARFARELNQRDGMVLFQSQPGQEGAPIKVYRGASPANADGSTMADGVTFMSFDRDAAAQYGEVYEYDLRGDIRLLDLSPENADARRILFGSTSPETLAELGISSADDLATNKQAFSELVADNDPESSIGMFPGKNAASIIKAFGYDGVKIGDSDFWVIGRPGDYAATETQRLFQSEQPATDDPSIYRQEARGSLTIGPAGYPGGMRQFLITLGQGADKSTFLHESAHFHLELLREVDAELRARDTESLSKDQKRLLADHDALLKWLGVDSFDAIEREHHEKYAETWEAYALEGRAPSVRLQRVLYKFSTWLKLIYRTLKGLPNASLTDEVREIFDRMLATDDEIDAARQAQRLTSMFTDPADYGMTDEEWRQFREAERVARQSAIEAEQGEQYRYVLAEQRRWKSEQMKALREEAAGIINDSPIYRVAYLLRKGTQPDGSPLPAGQRQVKLNRQEMVDVYGKEWVGKNLRGMVADDGVSAQQVAGLFGFADRGELANGLARVLPMAEAIKLEADRLWHERNPNPMLDGGLEVRVQQAVHNDAQAAVMVREINALQAKSGKPGQPVVLQVMKNAAERIVGATRVRDLNANRHKATEAREGKEAIRAAAEGRLDDAVAARKRQLMAGLLYRETLKAQERTESHRAHAVKLTKKSAQERFAKAGWENYLDKINQILEAYEFKRISNRALDRRQSLRAWVEAQQDAGEVTAVTPEILAMVEAGKVKNWRELSVGELDAINDALRNIEHLASLKNKLMAGARQAEKDEAIAEMVARAEEVLPETLDEDTPEGRRGLLERIGRRLGKMLESLNRPENVIEALDGGQSGPWHDFIWSALDRGEAKMTELRKAMMVKLWELRDSVPNDFLTGLNEPVDLFGQKVTRSELVGMVLNTGNAGNLQRLMDGGIPRKGGGRMRLNAQQVQQMRGMLTAQELRYVQGLWDSVGSLWPEIEALTRRVGGVRPEKIQAQPFTVRSIDGTEITMEGGYWPAVYDPKRSNQGDQQIEGDAKQMMMAEGFVRAATPKGYTKGRADKVNATLKTDFAAVMSRHLDQVMTDIAYREAVRDIDGLLRSEKIKQAIIFRLGQDAYDNLKGSLAYSVSASSLVAGRTATDWKWAVDTVFSNMSVSALAIRPDIMLGNLSAVIQGLNRVGVRATMRGMHAMMTQPQRTTDAIVARSAFMAARLGETDFWYQQELNRIQGDRGFGPAYKRLMMSLHRYADSVITRCLWWGHYQANLDKGEGEAIRLADKAIRQTQTASGRKDLSTFERDPSFAQTRQFMGPMFVIFGRLYAAARAQGADRQVGARVHTAMIQWFFAPAAFMLLAGRWAEDGDDDDDEVGLNEWALWVATSIGLFPVQTLPLVRDVGSAAEALLLDKPVSPRAPPVTQATENMIRASQSIARNIEGYMDTDEIDWWDMTRDLNTAGALFGAPASQVKITTKTLQYWTDDPEEGRTELAAMAVYGPPKDYKPQ